MWWKSGTAWTSAFSFQQVLLDLSVGVYAENHAAVDFTSQVDYVFEVSDPILVRGGAVLLHVRNPSPGFDIDPERARSRIESLLTNQAVEERMAELAQDIEPPPGSLVLEEEELIRRATSAAAEEELLRYGPSRLDAGSLRRGAWIIGTWLQY